MISDKSTEKIIPDSDLKDAPNGEEPGWFSYKKRDPELDPQLVWRGKYGGDDVLNITAPKLYIQEKIDPARLFEEIIIPVPVTAKNGTQSLPGLVQNFAKDATHSGKPVYYSHGNNRENRMILGDSLQVMASLAEHEGLRGKIQAIYVDPPYGIKFNSNFHWSTSNKDSGDRLENFTRKPEQVKAFRDAWKNGVHSYLNYLRDRLIAARELLSESGSIFVQIGEENVHRVRLLLDEIFGDNNFISQINFKVTSGTSQEKGLKRINNYVLWYAKNSDKLKFNRLFIKNSDSNDKVNTIPLHSSGDGDNEPRWFQGQKWTIPHGHWRHAPEGFNRLVKANRIIKAKNVIRSVTYPQDFPAQEMTNVWTDTGPEQAKKYVVQTNTKVIERCLLMATDPGDLVLDPTCGSGTTAFVAEQWGRRWITIDTSRVALAIARTRLMCAIYPYYIKAAERSTKTGNSEIDFVYERVPHISLKSIAANAEIDVLWEKWQKVLEPLRNKLNTLLGKNLEEWEIPVVAAEPWPERACELHKILGKAYKVKMPDGKTRPLLDELNQILKSRYKKIEQLPANPETAWPDEARALHAKWHEAINERQKEIDFSIANHAGFEVLYDQPEVDKNKIRVSGPFTVESISPHRTLNVESGGEVLDPKTSGECQKSANFINMILENLGRSGVQQTRKVDKLNFKSLMPWPGKRISAEGRWQDEENEKRAAIFVGPEFGTVSKSELLLAAQEAVENGFDCLIACGFNFDAQTGEISGLGHIPVLKTRMNPDLQIGELKNNGKDNLFVIFGEPDFDIVPEKDKDMPTGRISVKLKGVDVYYPNNGTICSNDAHDVTCWMVDTNYDGQCFCARQVYFPGQKNPYETLKTTLKAEIDPVAWNSLGNMISRPFLPPQTGLAAVKVINHLGDEAMKVFRFPQKG